MTPVQSWKAQAWQVGGLLVLAGRSGLQLLGQPYRFHRARAWTPGQRLRESVMFAGLASALLVLLYFVTVSAVVTIKQPIFFLLAGGGLNGAHFLMYALVHALGGKLVARQVPMRMHVENVFYATALLPIVAVLSQPLAHAQLVAMLADPSPFAFGYRAAIDAALSHSGLMSAAQVCVGLAYLYFSFLVYVGLRVTTGLPAWRAALAVWPGTMGVFAYQTLVLMPMQQQFVHAVTR